MTKDQKLTYLTKEQATELLNSSCLYCSTKIPTTVSKRTTTHESSDHGMSSEYERTVITSTVQDLDIYLIQVQPPKFPGLEDKMKGVYTKLENEIKEKTIALQHNLERQLTLPIPEKQRVIQSAIKDSLRDLEHKQPRFPPYTPYCDLEKKVEKLTGAIQLQDLQHQTLKSHNQEWTGSTSYAYNPGCLKTHIACWPFKEKPTMEWNVITMKFGQFYKAIIKITTFQNYPQHIEDAKEVLDWLKPQPINIAIKKYNPLDYMGRM